MIWSIQAADMDPAQQACQIISQLTGGAREIAENFNHDELTIGGQIGGRMADPVSYLLGQLAANVAPLGEEQRMQAMNDLFTFRRLPNETIDDLMIRFRLIRHRAATNGAGAAMTWEGSAFFLLGAIRPTPHQLVQLLDLWKGLCSH